MRVASDSQRSAIEAEPGPVLVVAGPGAGKTFCLIERIRFLVQSRGADPARTCAVTFTNRAAEEIQTRLRDALGRRADSVTRGTLHSLCMDLLRANCERVGLKRGFGVADEDYQRTVLRRLDIWPVGRHGRLLLDFGRRRRDGRSLDSETEAIFVRYQSFLRARNLVDFDDIIVLTRQLLLENEDVASQIRAQWDHVLVDEFQDLSRAQYDVIKSLVEEHSSLFGVGDDEQSIFSWTGADPKILDQFRRDFGISELIVLEENRRCSAKIVAASRNLLEANPGLFDKNLRPLKEGDFPVEAYAFPTQFEEGIWIVEDMRADRETHDVDWGDFAILYRKHRIGDDLERVLLAAGIPCRLARGRSIAEDRVVSYVIGSLRLMSASDEDVELERFAGRMLPEALMGRIRAASDSPENGFLTRLRTFASARRGEPDARKVWRLIYHVENLRAIRRSHSNLRGLVDDLLSQMRGPGRNVLEDRSDEISDPIAFPGANELADKLRTAAARGGCVWIDPASPAWAALLGMLIESGLAPICRTLKTDSRPSDLDVVIGSDGGSSMSLQLFKALQLVASTDFDRGMSDFVAFDLETTDADVDRCEIVEIAAARIRNGDVVDTFHSLVRPEREVSDGAREVHGYSDERLANEPPFESVWPEFKAFVGEDVLVAHNAQRFDIPVLRRMVRPIDSFEGYMFFDTLPMARSLLEGSAKLEHLAERFGVDKGRAHHAVDDSITLAHVLRHLNAHRLARSRKCSLANVLDYLALALALEFPGSTGGEAQVLFDAGRIFALGQYSGCLDFYRLHTAPDSELPRVEEIIERLGGEELRQRLLRKRTPAQRFPESVGRLAGLVEASVADDLDNGIASFLDRAALSTSRGIDVDPRRVNLLTLHSTKGLEFSRVYIVGVEDTEMPGWRELRDNSEREIQESRRLLYVGMTRAIDRLVLTRTDERFGNPSGGSKFLTETGVRVTGVGC